MAGCRSLVATSEYTEEAVSAIGYQWQVSFSRFFTYPSLPSTCPYLVTLPARYLRNGGTWISSRASNVSVSLLNCHSSSATIISVCFGGKILEEHYVSKLHFSWPQLSCVAGFPARGSRTVFVSYKDSASEIQKFAFRFSVFSEAAAFINALEDILKDPTESEPLNTDFRSEISSQSVFMSPNVPLSRACTEELNNTTPAEAYSPQLPLGLNCEVEQESFAKETTPSQNQEGAYATLPPSFTSLLSNYCPEVKQAAAQTNLSEEFDLKSQIAKYMEDSSFQDMLMKVEKVISEIGDDLIF